MLPSAEHLNALHRDGIIVEEDLERLLAKDVLKGREVEVLRRLVKATLLVEDTEGTDRMGV